MQETALEETMSSRDTPDRSTAFGGLVTSGLPSSDNRQPGKPAMRFGPSTYRDKLRGNKCPLGQRVSNVTVQKNHLRSTMPRLASVDRSTVDEKGIAPAHGRANVLSLPLWYLSRVAQYVQHGSGETPSSSSDQSHQTRRAHGL